MTAVKIYWRATEYATDGYDFVCLAEHDFDWLEDSECAVLVKEIDIPLPTSEEQVQVATHAGKEMQAALDAAVAKQKEIVARGEARLKEFEAKFMLVGNDQG